MHLHAPEHMSEGEGFMAERFANGISADLLSGVSWRKSKRSGALGNCVEVAPLRTGDIAVRNSRFPAGPALVYSRDEMAAFLTGAKDGEFDDIIS
jgi:hypothetical protein